MTTSTLSPTVDDDVEGHVFKELAIGLSTAGVLATGVVGAVHVTAGPAGATASSDGVAVTVQVPDGTDPVSRAASSAAHTAAAVTRDPVGRADRLTDATVAGARTTRDHVRTTATGAVSRTTTLAQQRVRATAGQVRQLETEACLTAQKTAHTVDQARREQPTASVSVHGDQVDVHVSLPLVGDQHLQVGLDH